MPWQQFTCHTRSPVARKTTNNAAELTWCVYKVTNKTSYGSACLQNKLYIVLLLLILTYFFISRGPTSQNLLCRSLPNFQDWYLVDVWECLIRPNHSFLFCDRSTGVVTATNFVVKSAKMADYATFIQHTSVPKLIAGSH